jgi:subtilisin family serine protease
MNRIRSASLLAPLFILAACAESPVVPSATAGRAAHLEAAPAPTGFIVSFKTDKIPASFASRVASLGGTVTASFDGAGLATVDGISATAAASLSDFGEVGSDASFQILDPVETAAVAATAAGMDNTVASPSNPAGAFFYARQWNMRAISANTAWAAGKLGSPSVKVAILDTGIDPTHVDLAGRVDAANSVSFVPADEPYRNYYFPTAPTWTDLHYHGTHVAATVASNGVAAAGVTSKTTLMAVKVLDVFGNGTTSAILNGIMYASNHGANVISMSIGNKSEPFSTKDKDNKDFFNKVLDRAFKYAHSKGVLFILAAGNESQNLDIPQTHKMFCGEMHVVCVSATGPTAQGSVNGPFTNPDAFAPYSNYGLGQIDIAAPGGNGIVSYVYAACSRTSLQIPVCQTGTYVVGLAGTSMATPHVSGLAALILAGQNIGNGGVRSLIFNSADDLGAPGKDAFYGNGRINVAKALGLQ